MSDAAPTLVTRTARARRARALGRLGLFALVLIASHASNAEQIRFNVAPGAFEVATIQGYDFVGVGGAGSTLSIEPFGAICPDGSGCPVQGSTYYLGFQSAGAQQGLSLRPTYPTAWAPYRVSWFAIAHAPGEPDFMVEILGFSYPFPPFGLPDFVMNHVVTDQFEPVYLPPDWTSLGDLHIVPLGAAPPAIFVDDIEATLAEPPPPDDALPEPNDCATFAFAPGGLPEGAWPIENLTASRELSYDHDRCFYLDLGGGLLEEVCDPYFEYVEPPLELGAFEAAFGASPPEDFSLTQSSWVGCDELSAVGEAAHPVREIVGPFGEPIWFNRDSRTRYDLEFDVVSPAALSIEGVFEVSAGVFDVSRPSISVYRTDGGAGLVYERRAQAGIGPEPIDDLLLLEPGSYEVRARLHFADDDASARFDVAFDFEEQAEAVPLAGAPAVCTLGAVVAAAGWRRLRRGVRRG